MAPYLDMTLFEYVCVANKRMQFRGFEMLVLSPTFESSTTMCEIPAGKIKAMTLENKPVSKLIEPQYLDLFLYELLTIYL